MSRTVLTLEEVLSRFPPARRVGPGKYRTTCPVHQGRSLVITDGSTSILFKCWAESCSLASILDAAGLTMNDVSPSRLTPSPVSHSFSKIDKIYSYYTLARVPVYDVLRMHTEPGEKKKFQFRKPTGNNGDYAPNVQGVERVPYHWPDLIGHPLIWQAEGEKDVERLISVGLPATCNAGGAGNWTAALSAMLVKAGVERVIIVQDKDPAGAAHALAVAKFHGAVGIQVVIVPAFVDVKDGGDVSDFFDLGHTVDELQALMLTAASAKVVATDGLDPAFYHKGVDFVAKGKQLKAEGVKYLVNGIIPAYGQLGMLVAKAKVGKTTLGQAMAAAVAMGRPFLDRATVQTKSLVILGEDGEEYAQYLASDLDLEGDWLDFWVAPMQLTDEGLARICADIQRFSYGFVLMSSWQALVRGMVKDENDNAGAVNIVEAVKLATRKTKIPWLIDAHAGKGEDQSDDADPTVAMRGASSAQGAADYSLSYRYAGSPYSTRRRLSGKGRFVDFAPFLIDFDKDTGAYSCLGDTKNVQAETTWRLICETGALTTVPQGLSELAVAIGFVTPGEKLSGTHRKQLFQALSGRDGVGRSEVLRRGRKTSLFARLVE